MDKLVDQISTNNTLISCSCLVVVTYGSMFANAALMPLSCLCSTDGSISWTKIKFFRASQVSPSNHLRSSKTIITGITFVTFKDIFIKDPSTLHYSTKVVLFLVDISYLSVLP